VTVLHTEVNPANGHTYMLLSESNWTDAEAAAVGLGGHLTTVNDVAENSWLLSTFGNWNGQSRDLWIGYNDELVEASFVWTSGQTPGYANWAPFQPDNNTGTDPNGEQYVHLYGTGSIYGPGMWNDIFDAGPGSAPWSPGLFGVAEIEGPSLSMTGTCPGPVTITVSGATPFGPVIFATGNGPGSFTIPGGASCAGLIVDLANPTARLTVSADLNGDVSLPVTLPPGVCGSLFVQAIDFSACLVSNVMPL